jgi:hypothetical protein
MQTSRWMLSACVTAIALLPLAARPGQDNEAQAKARQALEQKMKETPAQPAAPAQPQRPATPQPPPPAPAPTQAQEVWPEYKETPANPNSQALEDALHQKMTEGQGQPPVPAPKSNEPAPSPPAPAAATATAPTAAAAAAATPASMEDAKWDQVVMPPAASPEQLDKAQEALRQSTSATGAAMEPAASQPVEAAEPIPAKRSQKATASKRPSEVQSKLPPLPTPPPAFSASKEQRLQELLQQYMADRLSPEEYHAQRAKIVAEP